MDIISLYNDYNVQYRTEGHKHCRPGWVNVPCPYCTGNFGYHLGFEIEKNHFVCWRCGSHPLIKTLAILTNLSEPKVKDVLREYDLYIKSKDAKVTIRRKAFKFPSNVSDLSENHKIYLHKRNFDADKLATIWGLKGTGVLSTLDNINYKHRIILPYEWDGKIVSFDSRDITDKAINKYMACPLERELIPHKEILYGKQSKWKETGVCVEGPTDVWRMGELSFAVSGIKFTPKQVRVIAKYFKRVFILFDGASETSKEMQAQTKAKELRAELLMRNVSAELIKIEGDPGDLKQTEADYIIKSLIHERTNYSFTKHSQI